jgi:hypothetical protein
VRHDEGDRPAGCRLAETFEPVERCGAEERRQRRRRAKDEALRVLRGELSRPSGSLRPRLEPGGDVVEQPPRRLPVSGQRPRRRHTVDGRLDDECEAVDLRALPHLREARAARGDRVGSEQVERLDLRRAAAAELDDRIRIAPPCEAVEDARARRPPGACDHRRAPRLRRLEPREPLEGGAAAREDRAGRADRDRHEPEDAHRGALAYGCRNDGPQCEGRLSPAEREHEAAPLHVRDVE